MAKLPQSCGAGTAVSALGPRDRGASGIKPRSQEPAAAPGANAGHSPLALVRRGRILHGAAHRRQTWSWRCNVPRSS